MNQGIISVFFLLSLCYAVSKNCSFYNYFSEKHLKGCKLKIDATLLLDEDGIGRILIVNSIIYSDKNPNNPANIKIRGRVLEMINTIMSV
jgi:hypothetical protein